METNEKQKVIVITGPTASGKTALGALYAKTYGGEVVSADSMQVYKHMDIGTAKPTPEDMLGVPHHMIGIVEPWEDYSAARYITDAANIIDDILKRGKKPVIVGGTGLYIDSLLSGRVFMARADSCLRLGLEHEYDEIGGEAMLQKLSCFDTTSAEKLHPNDKKRIVRAFETYRTSGKAISQHDEETLSVPPRYEALKIALTYSDRAELYSRIDKRVERMLSSGFEQEVLKLMEMGVPQGATAMQAIGYKEMASVLSGRLTREAATERIKMESRRYAKRQLTWLRRDDTVRWIVWATAPDITWALKQVTDYLK